MKNIITLSIVSALTSLILVGCSTMTSSSESHSGAVHKNLTQEKIHDIIKAAGEESGWIMTEFKSNALIAEKANGDSSKSVTVTFDKHSFDVTPANSELENAISDALE